MFRRLLFIILVSISLASCSSTNQVTVGPEEPGTIADMDPAVQAAAANLLLQDSAPMAVIYFGFDDRDEVMRYDWIDYRPTGDLLVITKDLGNDETSGYARIDGVWSTSLVTADESILWTTEVPDATAEDTMPGIDQLLAMTGQDSNQVYRFETETKTVFRQGASDGSELWTLIISHENDEVLATQQWIISPEGVLQFYRFFAEDAAALGSYGAIIYEFGAGDETTEPVTAPEMGTPPRLDEFRIPDALRDLENQED